jgi:hypothetical protein
MTGVAIDRAQDVGEQWASRTTSAETGRGVVPAVDLVDAFDHILNTERPAEASRPHPGPPLLAEAASRRLREHQHPCLPRRTFPTAPS